MLKVVGAVIILCSCLIIARQFRGEQKRHFQLLKDFDTCLMLMRSEIIYLQTPLPTIFADLQRKAPERYRDFFRMITEKINQSGSGQIEQLWKETVLESDVLKCLSKEEKQLLIESGTCLGHADIYVQKTKIGIHMEEVERQIQVMEKTMHEKQKLTQYLCVMAGMFLVLILI